MIRSSTLLVSAGVLLVLAVSAGDGQLFSSSGLVFPGPPGQQVRRKASAEGGDQQQQRQAPGRPTNQPQRGALPVPLSLIGQQPEEFVAAAQRRQQAAAQRAAAQQEEQEEAEERDAEEAEADEPPPQQRQQQPERPQQPAVQRRQQQEPQRPEPSINQAHQQPRRPNYPNDYKPSPQPGNAVDQEGGRLRRPPGPSRPAQPEPEEAEEEEEVKPDKLQILLQKTNFNCADKKDGYYADEEVDCEIFHYCQDRTRHSWLCPEGATFHQVHLLCMPAGKENICQKSSQFHFVNDYLYKTVDNDDGSNSSSGIYADRYYPDGYEQGVPYDFESSQPEDRPNYQPFNRRQQQPAVQQQRKRIQPRPEENGNRRSGQAPRRPVQQAPKPFQVEEEEDDEVPSFNIPAFRQQDVFERRSRPQQQQQQQEEPSSNEEDDE